MGEQNRDESKMECVYVENCRRMKRNQESVMDGRLALKVEQKEVSKYVGQPIVKSSILKKTRKNNGGEKRKEKL